MLWLFVIDTIVPGSSTESWRRLTQATNEPKQSVVMVVPTPARFA